MQCALKKYSLDRGCYLASFCDLDDYLCFTSLIEIFKSLIIFISVCISPFLISLIIKILKKCCTKLTKSKDESLTYSFIERD